MEKNVIAEYAKREYERWLCRTQDDEPFQRELKELAQNEEEMIDAFAGELHFGTSGIRGILGPGTNRMNAYVVRRTTQGLAAYLNRTCDSPSVVIAYDSRRNSRFFAEAAAKVLRGNEVSVFLFPKLAPVSLLSFAVRQLKTSMGIMITASHNPKIFNGYKVYNRNGYQIVGEEAEQIWAEIDDLDYFAGIRESAEGIQTVEAAVPQAFIDKIVSLSTVKENVPFDRELSVIYTPLNGTGGRYVREVLRRIGFCRVQTVPSQEKPDGGFPTCPVPNPEKITAYGEGFKLLDEGGGDIVIATDPDCDRVGVCLCHDGMKVLLTGNQLGILMLDYLCQVRKPVLGQFVIKSIVSAPLIDKMAEHYGLRVVNTLTGFKYIGEIITWLDARGRGSEFYFGFEESNGYLIDPFIRDKDGVSSSLLAAEMAAFYKSQGKDLLDRLDEIYRKFGMCIDKTHNYFFEGPYGGLKMARVMDYFRSSVERTVGSQEIAEKTDYMGETGLPKSDVLRYRLEDGTEFVIRPSGTEPKLKLYIFQSKAGGELDKEIGKIIAEQSASV